MEAHKFQILVLGGGTGGVIAAAQLKRKDPSLDIGIIEPNEKHYYQPAWTLVGAGTFDLEKTIRNEKDVIPKGVKWIKGRVAEVIPADNMVKLEDGRFFSYEELIVAVGIQINYDAIPGLKEGIGNNGITTNYDPAYAEYTFECLKKIKKGNALFTQAPTPIKCGGAPQKITYLGDHYFRKKGKRDEINVILALPGTKIFGVPKFEKLLDNVVRTRDIHARFFHELVEIRPDKKEAVYVIGQANTNPDYLKEDANMNIRIEDSFKVVIPFEIMHLAPPQSAPDFIKNSPLAVHDSPWGWVDVDQYTLQHSRFKNVWSLGDVASTPNAKTGASIRKQAPVLVKNLLTKINGGDIQRDYATYNGYASCPIVTRYGRMVLAEFDYHNNPTPSFPINMAKERYSMWVLKKYGLPWLYWNKMLKGDDF